jgi:hypothetical protein
MKRLLEFKIIMIKLIIILLYVCLCKKTFIMLDSLLLKPYIIILRTMRIWNYIGKLILGLKIFDFVCFFSFFYMYFPNKYRLTATIGYEKFGKIIGILSFLYSDRFYLRTNLKLLIYLLY